MSGKGKNDYYSRLDTCPYCHATRGNRCVNEEGRETTIAHGARVLASGGTARTQAAVEKYIVACATCNAEEGQPCRTGPFRTRMSGIHAARKRAVEELEKEASVAD